jgi:hypothetical protein
MVARDAARYFGDGCAVRGNEKTTEREPASTRRQRQKPASSPILGPWIKEAAKYFIKGSSEAEKQATDSGPGEQQERAQAVASIGFSAEYLADENEARDEPNLGHAAPRLTVFDLNMSENKVEEGTDHESGDLPTKRRH